MKNTEIAYGTSTNYEELYRLLKEGIVVIGFISIADSQGNNSEYSRCVELKYLKEYGKFDFSVLVFFESDFSEDDFCELCKEENLRFIPILEK